MCSNRREGGETETSTALRGHSSPEDWHAHLHCKCSLLASLEALRCVQQHDGLVISEEETMASPRVQASQEGQLL